MGKGHHRLRRVALCRTPAGPLPGRPTTTRTCSRAWSPHRLDALSIRRPRQWGAFWLALELWRELRLDSLWSARLGSSREGTHWETVLTVLVAYRLIDPGSEWRLHRHWFDHTALADLLGGDFALAAKDTLYRCHDRLLDHKEALFSHLHDRWRDLFNATHEVLLYDLTSTYFESDPPFPEGDKRRHGYSRVSGRSKPARDGRMKTSHFAVGVALGAVGADDGKVYRVTPPWEGRSKHFTQVFFDTLYALNIRKGIYPREDRLEPGQPVVSPDEEFSPEP